jgi:hypothetical protein
MDDLLDSSRRTIKVLDADAMIAPRYRLIGTTIVLRFATQVKGQ